MTIADPREAEGRENVLLGWRAWKKELLIGVRSGFLGMPWILFRFLAGKWRQKVGDKILFLTYGKKQQHDFERNCCDKIKCEIIMKKS